MRAGLHFRYLRAEIERKTVMAMQQEIADAVLKKAKELVPVRTGALRSSGRTAKTPDRKGVEVRFGNSRVLYAEVVEFGRMSFAPFPPKPYMRPAVAYVKRYRIRHIAKKHIGDSVKNNLPKVIM